MREVRSVLECTKCALRNHDEIDVYGVVAISHDSMYDIVGEFDSVSLQAVSDE